MRIIEHRTKVIDINEIKLRLGYLMNDDKSDKAVKPC